MILKMQSPSLNQPHHKKAAAGLHIKETEGKEEMNWVTEYITEFLSSLLSIFLGICFRWGIYGILSKSMFIRFSITFTKYIYHW